jgi:hypothetical protein
MFSRSPFKGRYDQAVDRESAYEMLRQKAQLASAADLEDIQSKVARRDSSAPRQTRTRETATEALFKSAARSIGSQVGRQIVRGVLGSLLGGRR